MCERSEGGRMGGREREKREREEGEKRRVGKGRRVGRRDMREERE